MRKGCQHSRSWKEDWPPTQKPLQEPLVTVLIYVGPIDVERLKNGVWQILPGSRRKGVEECRLKVSRLQDAVSRTLIIVKHLFFQVLLDRKVAALPRITFDQQWLIGGRLVCASRPHKHKVRYLALHSMLT